jgi:hypothetical protein
LGRGDGCCDLWRWRGQRSARRDRASAEYREAVTSHSPGYGGAIPRESAPKNARTLKGFHRVTDRRLTGGAQRAIHVCPVRTLPRWRASRVGHVRESPVARPTKAQPRERRQRTAVGVSPRRAFQQMRSRESGGGAAGRTCSNFAGDPFAVPQVEKQCVISPSAPVVRRSGTDDSANAPATFGGARHVAACAAALCVAAFRGLTPTAIECRRVRGWALGSRVPCVAPARFVD